MTSFKNRWKIIQEEMIDKKGKRIYVERKIKEIIKDRYAHGELNLNSSYIYQKMGKLVDKKIYLPVWNNGYYAKEQGFVNELLQQQLNQQIVDKEKEDLAKQQKQSFENNLKCQERLDALRLQYDNVASAYYDELSNTCWVRYYDVKNNNKVLEAPMDNMVPVIKETPLSNGTYTTTKGVYFRESAGVNGTIIQKIDPTNIVNIISYTYVNTELWYYVYFDGKYGWLSSLAFK